jgi:hypothetical protein
MNQDLLTKMASFDDIYHIPLVGHTIHKFLDLQDDACLDSTNKDIRDFHRKYVYPMIRKLDLDTLQDYSTHVSYLKKISPFLEEITCQRNSGQTALPSVRCLPNLKHVTYAVPIVLDTTLQRIDTSTHRLWAHVNGFLRSLALVENNVETVNIIPGVVKLVRVDIEEDEVLEEHILEDTTEGSHFQLYRRYGMPVMLNFRLTKDIPVKIPGYLTSVSVEKFINWNTEHTGITSLILDLL